MFTTELAGLLAQFIMVWNRQPYCPWTALLSVVVGRGMLRTVCHFGNTPISAFLVVGVLPILLAMKLSGLWGQAAETSSPCKWHRCILGKNDVPVYTPFLPPHPQFGDLPLGSLGPPAPVQDSCPCYHSAAQPKLASWDTGCAPPQDL